MFAAKQRVEPYYQETNVTIYCGKAEDLVYFLGPFDLLLTDPPYGHGNKWSGGTWASNNIYQDAFLWDKEKVPLHVLKQYISKCKQSIIWGGNYYDLPGSRCYLSWNKRDKMETMADFELAWTNINKPSKGWTELRNPDGKRKHPTQKPLTLIRWCIQFAGKEIESIVDPFMGSGTTLVAARDLGKRCVGIDINERYCEQAAKRLSQMVFSF